MKGLREPARRADDRFAATLRHPSGKQPTPLGFELRLLSTLIISLLMVGVAQFWMTSRGAEQQFLDEAIQRAQADVVFLQDAFHEAPDEDTRNRRLNERLASIGQRPGNEYVLLMDRYGVVIAADNVVQLGTYHGGSDLRSVVKSGQPSATLVDSLGRQSFRYIIPVRLPSGLFVLEVAEDASIVEGQAGALKKSTAITSAAGIAIGIVLFLLLGGRSVISMHRRALQLSTKDGLTDLENHRSFQEALVRTINVAQRQGSPVSLALIDVDDFKLINDRLGHAGGDAVLKKLAACLDTGRLGDVPYRIGGDEFAMILPGANTDGAWIACQRLWKRIASEVEGVTVSIGIATVSGMIEHGDLCDHADTALYEAKRRGRNNVVTFEELGGEAVVPGEKVRAVRRLIEEQKLGIAFQPIWDLNGDRPLGFEALARPPADYGLQGPYELFSIGEMIGRTQDLDALAWKSALDRIAELPDDVLLFVNISPFTADHGDGPVDRLIEVVEQSRRMPSQIVVEFTEKWSGRRDLVIQQAERLRAAGFRLALDDVGAGSGDLEMMARLPVDFIKIDLHVVQNALTDPTSKGVLFAIAAFAAHSGSTVIAEGIEDQETLDFVRELGAQQGRTITVRGAQGYFLGRPAEGPPIIPPTPYAVDSAVTR